MTMHRYAWPKADEFLRKVTELHERYGKPVWVTEYAVADWDATSTRPCVDSRAQTEDFMRATVAGMRAMPLVERLLGKPGRPGTSKWVAQPSSTRTDASRRPASSTRLCKLLGASYCGRPPGCPATSG